MAATIIVPVWTWPSPRSHRLCQPKAGPRSGRGFIGPRAAVVRTHPVTDGMSTKDSGEKKAHRPAF
jgi:hypothetical protein